MASFVIAAPVELVKQPSTPANPPTGTLLLYPKSDDKLYVLTAGGVETQVGSGGASGVPNKVASGASYTVPSTDQVFAALDITADGEVIIDGELVFA